MAKPTVSARRVSLRAAMSMLYRWSTCPTGAVRRSGLSLFLMSMIVLMFQAPTYKVGLLRVNLLTGFVLFPWFQPRS